MPGRDESVEPRESGVAARPAHNRSQCDPRRRLSRGRRGPSASTDRCPSDPWSSNPRRGHDRHESLEIARPTSSVRNSDVATGAATDDHADDRVSSSHRCRAVTGGDRRSESAPARRRAAAIDRIRRTTSTVPRRARLPVLSEPGSASDGACSSSAFSRALEPSVGRPRDGRRPMAGPIVEAPAIGAGLRAGRRGCRPSLAARRGARSSSARASGPSIAGAIATALAERLASRLDALAGSPANSGTRRPPSDSAGPSRARSWPRSSGPTRAGAWAEAEALLDEFEADSPMIRRSPGSGNDSTAARRGGPRGHLAQLDAARQVNDPDRVLELYRAAEPVARGRPPRRRWSVSSRSGSST